MLGRANHQMTFEDVFGWRERIPKDSFWWKFKVWADEHIKDDDFADLFSEGGRPSVSPSKVVRGILVQLHMGYSDRSLEEGSAYDDRVKLALGMRRSDPPLDASTLCRHRQKLFSSKKADALLKKVVSLAKEQGIISEEAEAMVDSFMVKGACSRQDTFTLIRQAILRVLKICELHGIDLRVSLIRDDYRSKKKPSINWDDPEEKRALLESLVKDARALIDAASSIEGIPEELKDAVELLKRVAEQDIEEDEKGIRIKDGVSQDRVISVVDPEMRHGRKSSSYKVDGYKAHVMAAGEDGSFITAVEVTAANAPDGDLLEDVIDSSFQNGVNPVSVVGDTAYGSGEIRQRMEEKGISLIAPAPPVSKKEGFFSKEDFEINVDEGYCRCPAGVVTKKMGWGNDGRGSRIKAFKFPDRVCASCPMKPRCTSSVRGRQVRIGRHELLLQEARRIQKAQEFKETYKRRCFIERTICHVKRHGGSASRFLGKAKTRFQIVMAAVLHDIKQLIKRLPIPPTDAPSQAVVSP